VPVLVVQHMPPIFTGHLAEGFASKCALTVVEAKHGMLLAPRKVFIAPGGKHMRVVDDGSGGHNRLDLTEEPPENFCRPSADYMFRSLATQFRGSAIGVILTGMGQDGAKGLLQMRQAGASTLGQDAATCTVYGMPREAYETGAVEEQLPLDHIAERIVHLVG
jgi:two-component system chemotaxis response regulator CheB